MVYVTPMTHAPDQNQILHHLGAVESNAKTYARHFPMAISRAQGIHLFDSNGRRYIDCLAAAGTLILGHNHPEIKAAITQAMATDMPMQALDIATPAKDWFVRQLFALLPPNLATSMKIQFCGPSGADAVEAAVKLAKIATGRETLWAVEGGYHGMTHGAMALSQQIISRHPIANLMPGVEFLPFPQESDHPETWLSSTDTQPAALILELVQGEGGVRPLPKIWVQALAALLKQRGILLIIDEVQTFGGRTGTFFAFEQYGIEPDILVLSKAIGGGLPLALILYRQDLDVWPEGAHAGTFRGNQWAMVAGAKTLEIVQNEGLLSHARQMGRVLKERLAAIGESFPMIREVRGLGLMLGMEIESTIAARLIRQGCFDHGLIVELGGKAGNIVRFLPPLIIETEDIERIIEIFSRVVAEVSKMVAPSHD